MRKIKNKRSILIGILLIILTISFISYKIYLLKKYDTKEFEKNYKRFCELYKNKEVKNVVYSNKLLETLNFKEINFGNILGKYEVEDESDIYKIYKNDNKRITITSLENWCEAAKYNFESKTFSLSTEKWCKTNGVVNDLKFLEYMYNAKEKKVNIFSSKDTIKRNWYFSSLIFNLTPDVYKKLIILNGNLTGYMYETDVNIVDIHLSNKNKEYLISLKNVDDVDSFVESISFSHK